MNTFAHLDEVIKTTCRHRKFIQLDDCNKCFSESDIQRIIDLCKNSLLKFKSKDLDKSKYIDTIKTIIVQEEVNLKNG